MSKLIRHGERVIPDFIEEDYISAIETGLSRSYYYRDKQVEIRRISQAEETELGYDGVLTTLVPFYIQFKRSAFYTPRFHGDLSTQRNAASLPTNMGFFAFELLKKDGGYSQHNALFKLSQKAKAVYVAPMFYKSAELTKLKSIGATAVPTFYRDILFDDLMGIDTYIFRKVLQFKNSITIPPHGPISDMSVSHHYTYSRDFKVGFHSEPINLGSRGQTLNYFLREILRYQNQSLEQVQSSVDAVFRMLPDLFNTQGEVNLFDEILRASINRVSAEDASTSYTTLSKDLTIVDKLLLIEDILLNYFNVIQLVKYESFR